MKKFLNKSLTIVLAAILLITAVPLSGLKDVSDILPNAAAAEYNNGDIIEFGSYPQSEVKDKEILAALNSINAEWISYGYYSGKRDNYSNDGIGSMKQGDWMKYCDVEYNGAKYRGVYFTQYRPHYTDYSSSTDNSFQDDNGYYINTYYWFKFEPLKWIVLDSDEGFLLSEQIIDSQPYQNLSYEIGNEYDGYVFYNNPEKTVYQNDYVTSSIRKWLNEDFYNTSFTSDEKSEIGITELDNSACLEDFSEFDCETTNDKIFLMSFADIDDVDYGFVTGASRQAKGTDYSKAQGIDVERYEQSEGFGNSIYRLRSPGSSSCSNSEIIYSGVMFSELSPDCTFGGIRPALKFNPKPAGSKPHNPSPGYLIGDVSGDGAVNSSDARIALRIALSLDSVDEIALLAADVNGDNRVTSLDARIILRVALKLQSF